MVSGSEGHLGRDGDEDPTRILVLEGGHLGVAAFLGDDQGVSDQKGFGNLSR